MKFIPLHTTNTSIVYKNALCSTATLVVILFIMLSVMIPVALVSLLSPYSGISESRILYEQPRVDFEYQYIFVATLEPNLNSEFDDGETDEGFLACSSFASFNERMQPYTNKCEGTKYWIDDFDLDGHTDRAHFQLQLDAASQPEKARIKSFDLILFFQAKLQHKCELTPPALLTLQHILPSATRMTTGNILLQTELQLKQYVEFTCPFPGRCAKTHFRPVQIDTNGSYADMTQYTIESLLDQVKANPGYFQLSVQESYYRPSDAPTLRISLDLDILQVPARYYLSIWERLGQFWLYFASFFGISFYIMNKVKDFLFGRHIIRSWEIIPWKKLY